MTKPDFEFKFHTRFGPGEVTWPMKIEDWAIRRDDWLGRLVLTYLVPWLYEFWVKVKTEGTMRHVDNQAETLRDTWDSEDDWMLEPTQEIVEDDQSPLGISELKSSYDFMDDKDT